MPGTFQYSPAGDPPYFTRPEVVAAIHAPTSFQWIECAKGNVFVHGVDKSAMSIEKVLPQVIEHTNRVLISNGDFDFVVMTNGTLIEIQNMTWNGHLGFQSPPYEPWILDTVDVRYDDIFAVSGLDGVKGPRGQQGYYHEERGLMWVQTFQAGHMQPEFQPRAAYRHLEWLLGRVQSISDASPPASAATNSSSTGTPSSAPSSQRDSGSAVREPAVMVALLACLVVSFHSILA